MSWIFTEQFKSWEKKPNLLQWNDLYFALNEYVVCKCRENVFFSFFREFWLVKKKYKFGNSNFDISAASFFTRNDRKNYRFVPISSTHFYSQVVCCSGTSSKFRTLSSFFQGDILTIFIYRAWSDSNLGRIVWNTKVLTTRIQEACLNITYCPNFRKWSSS